MPNELEGAIPNHDIQAVFLNGARRSKLLVTVLLMSGESFDAIIKSFDRFSVVVEHSGSDELLFKHASASIRPARASSSSSE